ncbi:ERI1 exoribonuclease 3 [Cephus cinctus]|uniref:ERI1 exoribonuclease 3 n=1 Tax=Cephus cinctus TaxID=211228 RepID=A0AAJ7CA10_CEPCN|nr:ERI1 exoribonuclease 3 [Cephus cinctus]
MARIAPKGYVRSIKNLLKEPTQPFKNLLVLDLECTCDKDKEIVPQEIIELPCVAIRIKDWKVQDVFHEYIKPRFHPTLTPFCTELTGIMQETVDDQKHFPETFFMFCKWLTEGGFFEEGNESAFVTSGDWDLKVMLPKQCELEGITVPEYFTSWIDLKRIFATATQYYPRSLRQMLVKLQLPMHGRLHSGIDDVTNMIKVMEKLSKSYKPRYNITSTLK